MGSWEMKMQYMSAWMYLVSMSHVKTCMYAHCMYEARMYACIRARDLHACVELSVVLSDSPTTTRRRSLEAGAPSKANRTDYEQEEEKKKRREEK